MRWLLAPLLGASLTLALAAGTAAAGNNTYCVGAPSGLMGDGACGSDAVRARHDRWHFHTYVGDGASCWECFDERDNTCETDFLRGHPGWTAVSVPACLALGFAPEDEGVRFHVIGGQDVATAPVAQPVTVTTEANPLLRGPYARGERVPVEVHARVGRDQHRPFGSGTLVLRDGDSGEELSRTPVVDGGDGRASVEVVMPREGRLVATFEIEAARLQAGEREAARDAKHWSFSVQPCGRRARVEPVPAWVLAGDRLALRGEVRDGRGQLVPPTGSARFALGWPEGELFVPARPDGEAWVGELVVPELPGDPRAAQLQLLVDDEAPVCPEAPVSLTLSGLPLSLRAQAPPSCWTGRPCEVTFFAELPPSGAPRERALALLADPGLEVLARSSGARIPATGSGPWTVSTTPESPGRLHFSLELLWSGQRSVEAEVAVDVGESISLLLPEEVNLGRVEGGAAPSESCVPLDFSAGTGTLGGRFSVSLAEPCAECEATLVSVVGGQQFTLPLDEIVLGADEALPICLSVARCPTGPDGGVAELIVRPVEPEFADQERRVTVRWRVAGRSWIDCWSGALGWLAGGVLLLVLLYGFLRPQGFPPGSAVRIAGSERHLDRAPRLLLEEQPGGRRGWYRSARVFIDAGGGVTRRRRDALLVFFPLAGGVAVRSHAGLTRQDRRTRQLEPLPAEEARGGTLLSRGRIHGAGTLVFKAGS